MSGKVFIKVVMVILLLQLTTTSSFGQVYERAGWEAQLSTLFHDVAGTVRIVDHNTLEVEGFHYDGGGPAVYFYLAKENTNASFENGIPVGPLLTGTLFEDSALTIDLPAGLTLDDYNAISVWCAAVSVNFGSGLFGSVVEYEVVFDATWSQATHQYLPENPHFSGLIGGTHNKNLIVWELGGLASDGIEDMAERGRKSPLDMEIETAIRSGQAYSLISGPGVGASPDVKSTVFKMSSSHPYATLVTMLAPSPDWFAGVSALPLFEDGKWTPKKVIDLYPYDAGTDSGADFTSPNDDTNPPEPITQLVEFPFENEPPVGTFTFTLLCKNSPVGDLNGDCRVDFTDFALMMENWLLDCNLTPTDPACQ